MVMPVAAAAALLVVLVMQERRVMVSVGMVVVCGDGDDKEQLFVGVVRAAKMLMLVLPKMNMAV